MTFPFSNTVISFKTRAFDQAPTQPHPPLATHYTHNLLHRDERTTLHDIIIHIVSYCDDNTRYTAALTLSQLIAQIQLSIDRAGDFSLITKLGRKHTKCSVAIINHPPDESPLPSSAPPGTTIITAHTHVPSKHTPNRYTSQNTTTTPPTTTTAMTPPLDLTTHYRILNSNIIRHTTPISSVSRTH